MRPDRLEEVRRTNPGTFLAQAIVYSVLPALWLLWAIRAAGGWTIVLAVVVGLVVWGFAFDAIRRFRISWAAHERW